MYKQITCAHIVIGEFVAGIKFSSAYSRLGGSGCL